MSSISAYSAYIKNAMKSRMDELFQTIAFTEKMMVIIPVGNITSEYFDTSYEHESFIKTFSPDEQTYLKQNYADHHELYVLEQQSIAELSNLRNLYAGVEQDEYVRQAMEKSSLIFATNHKLVIGGKDIFSEDAFGEKFDWIK